MAKLAATSCESPKAGTKGEAPVGDGLWLRLQRVGGKTWVIDHDFGGRRTKYTISPCARDGVGHDAIHGVGEFDGIIAHHHRITYPASSGRLAQVYENLARGTSDVDEGDDAHFGAVTAEFPRLQPIPLEQEFAMLTLGMG